VLCGKSAVQAARKWEQAHSCRPSHQSAERRVFYATSR